MSKEIIHICTDEKFIELTKYQFNEIKGDCNSYFIVVNDKNKPLKYVTIDSQTKVIDEKELVQLAENLPLDSLIIFHSLVKQFYDFIEEVKERHTLMWIFFGMEIYNDNKLYSSKKLYAPLTYQLYPPKKESLNKNIKDNLRPLIRLFKPSLALSKKELKIKIVNSFSYIGLLYKEEFDYISRLGKIKNTKHFFYTYYPLEKIVEINEGIAEFKNKLMIGNSGHLTSNHLDVFKKISKYAINEHEILLPLSYGKSDYIEVIKEHANQVFSQQKLNFLDNFLPLNEYNLILQKVQIFILYTRRQQGVGNIIALLWHGAKVFLSNKNTFYHYLKRIGVKVYCYETELNEHSINQGLSSEEIKHNREILYEHLNEKYLLEQLKSQLAPILQN